MDTMKLHESGSLVDSKASNGVFPIRIITEGKGSSATYTAKMLKDNAKAFEGAPSYMNHPPDINKPHTRDVTTIAGRLVGEVRYEEKDGVGGLYSNIEVDERWVPFVEKYHDVVGLSVYIDGKFTEQEGVRYAESFDGSDPYKSVDFVVAGGRGGKVEKAMESLRAIENSAGTPAGSEASERTQEKEKMTDEIEKLTATVATLVESVNTFITKQSGDVQAKVDEDAVKDVVKTAVESYAEKDKAITDAKLLPTQADKLRDAAKRGEDVAPLIEAEKKVLSEFAESVGEKSVEALQIGSSSRDEDWSMIGTRFSN